MATAAKRRRYSKYDTIPYDLYRMEWSRHGDCR